MHDRSAGTRLICFDSCLEFSMKFRIWGFSAQKAFEQKLHKSNLASRRLSIHYIAILSSAATNSCCGDEKNSNLVYSHPQAQQVAGQAVNCGSH